MAKLSPEETLSVIVRMLADRMGFPVSDISDTTELGDTLGMDGADAENFMAEYFSGFAIDTMQFEFDEYFGPEAGCLLGWIPGRRRLRPITVGHLRNCALIGKWVSPSQD